MLRFPDIDPIIFQLGPVAIRWYGLAYVLGIVGGIQFAKRWLMTTLHFTEDDVWSYMTALIIGIVIGGRLGYVLIYDPIYYSQHLLESVAIWRGGMSYHGGAVGCVIASWFFSKHRALPFLGLLDILGISSTIGLLMGRLANFINGELYGRVTTVPWGMVFPTGGPLPRHPSQLYEAGLEGVLLFLILFVCLKKFALKQGQLFALYLFFYGMFRFFVEFVREPDAHLGLVFSIFSTGQLLSTVMMGAGFGLFIWVHRHKGA